MKREVKIRISGFTLLEIMIALAIIGLTLVTVLYTVNYHYENMVTTQLVQFAKEKINEAEINKVNSKGSFEGTDITYETTVSPTEEDPDLVEVKTVVKEQEKKIILNELIRNKEGGN